ncbi:MAG: hypothetical protein KAQ99_08165 [Candidatus Aureabacteria bacterium]|nr:hypothetical protein [Candidatus Auribacterota bacterium]
MKRFLSCIFVWVFVLLVSYAGAGIKKTIAVSDFENKAGFSSEWNLGSGMAEMVTTSLANSGSFIVVERQNIQGILQEQDFSASGRTTKAGAPEFGKLLNAQILVSGAVTEFAERSSGGGTGFTIKGFSFGGSGSFAHVAVNVRLYDVTTGQVIASKRVEGKAKSSGMSIGYARSGWGIGTSKFKKAPLGKATQAAIDVAIAWICAELENVSWQGKVVTVKGEDVYLNCGADSGVQVGDEFAIYSVGEDLIDPDTGISLGCESEKTGRVQVYAVEEKFSKARIIAGGGFERGYLVKQS